jgi:hypothetical protein
MYSIIMVKYSEILLFSISPDRSYIFINYIFKSKKTRNSFSFPMHVWFALPNRDSILNFLGAQESIPPAYVAWWAETTTLLLLGSHSQPP